MAVSQGIAQFRSNPSPSKGFLASGLSRCRGQDWGNKSSRRDAGLEGDGSGECIQPQGQAWSLASQFTGILAEGATALSVKLSGGALFAHLKLFQVLSSLIVKVILAICV